jgi:hypothetical protein
MIIGRQASEKRASRLATARFDRESAAPDAASWLAMTLQIPVGFEDEAGFHCGVQQTQEHRLQASTPENLYTNPHQF